jgi:hypothetical protein
MGPPSYMRSVVDRNVVMRRIPVYAHIVQSICPSYVCKSLASRHIPPLPTKPCTEIRRQFYNVPRSLIFYAKEINLQVYITSYSATEYLEFTDFTFHIALC